MGYVIKNRIVAGKDLRSIQQPLDKDGFTNSVFDKLYPDKNPWRGTERDRNFKGKSKKGLKECE